MRLHDHAYEMPLETEDSFNAKVESEEIKKEKNNIDDNWIPDSFWEPTL